MWQPRGENHKSPLARAFLAWETVAPDREIRLTVRPILRPNLGQIYELEELSLKKLFFIIPSVLLLLAAGLLLLCKHAAKRTALACWHES